MFYLFVCLYKAQLSAQAHNNSAFLCKKTTYLRIINVSQ